MPHHISNYLRKHRLRFAFSEKEIAKLLGYRSETCVSRLELDYRTPTLEVALGCQVIFGEPPSEIFPILYAEIESQVVHQAELMARRLERRKDPHSVRKLTCLRRILSRAQARPATDAKPPGI
jgi:hypothetical protein